MVDERGANEVNTIVVPADGRPTSPTSSDALAGTDGNAFAVIGNTSKLLREAGASASFVAAYKAEAMSGDYDHLLAVSVAYLDLDLLDPPGGIVR